MYLPAEKVTTIHGSSGGDLPAIKPATTVKQAIGAASAATAVLGARLVRLLATADCHVVFGSDPTATTDDMLLKADQPEYFVCDETDKIAVIRDSADGQLYITPAV